MAHEDTEIDDFCDDDREMFSQPSLCAAIMKYMERCGVKTVNQRQMNAIINGATIIWEEMGKPHQPAVAGQGLQSWLGSYDTGMSSKYLAEQLANAAGIKVSWYGCGGRPSAVYGVCCPEDPSDFGRCIRMLEAEPRLREYLGVMNEGSGDKWSALAKRWPELEDLYREEASTGQAPKLYALMKSLFVLT